MKISAELYELDDAQGDQYSWYYTAECEGISLEETRNFAFKLAKGHGSRPVRIFLINHEGAHVEGWQKSGETWARL